jgi:hypothetical protein
MKARTPDSRPPTPKWLDHQGSFTAAVAAGPVFRLLGAKDFIPWAEPFLGR